MFKLRNNRSGEERRADIMKFIREYQATRGIPPTLREISAEVGTNPSVVRTHLLTLDKQGFIRYYPREARGIVVIK